MHEDWGFSIDDVRTGFNRGWWWGCATGAFIVISLITMLLGIGLYLNY